MAYNFSTQLSFDGKTVAAVFVPEFRTTGQFYEVNVKGYPRFHMTWTELGRYDIVGEHKQQLPYNLILAASDAIEEEARQK
jgi:hypothetical protein